MKIERKEIQAAYLFVAILGQPPSAQKKMLSSLKNHWSGLTVFLDHPQTPMANNKAENSARNPARGRKNY